VYIKGTRIPMDVHQITRMGVRCREIEGGIRFSADTVEIAMRQLWCESDIS